MDIVAGVQVPEMPFVDVDGRAGGDENTHSGPMGSNVGTILGSRTTFNVLGVPGQPSALVSVTCKTYVPGEWCPTRSGWHWNYLRVPGW